MISCIHMLINDLKDEENLECLCTLFKTIGGQLEDEMKQKTLQNPTKCYPAIDPYFTRLRQAVAERSTSARVRCLIQDVLDMRDRGWRERDVHAADKPRTIQEIHEEEAAKAQENAVLGMEFQNSRRGQDRDTGGRSTPRNRPTGAGRSDVNEITNILSSMRNYNQNSAQAGSSQVS